MEAIEKTIQLVKGRVSAIITDIITEEARCLDVQMCYRPVQFKNAHAYLGRLPDNPQIVYSSINSHEVYQLGVTERKIFTPSPTMRDLLLRKDTAERLMVDLEGKLEGLRALLLPVALALSKTEPVMSFQVEPKKLTIRQSALLGKRKAAPFRRVGPLKRVKHDVTPANFVFEQEQEVR